MSKKNVLTRSRKAKADELIHQGRLREACDLYFKVCQMDPGDAETWLKLSDTQRRLDELTQAESSGRQAVTLQPKSELAHLALGLALHAQGRFDEAVTSYRQGIALQPNRADAYYMLGNALIRAGGPPSEAAEKYRRAVKLQPDYVDA